MPEAFNGNRPKAGRGNGVFMEEFSIATDANGDGSTTIQFSTDDGDNLEYATFRDKYISVSMKDGSVAPTISEGSGSFTTDLTITLTGEAASTTYEGYALLATDRSERV